jgi:hypothetical protein
MSSEWLTAPVAAARLGTTAPTVRALIRDDDLRGRLEQRGSRTHWYANAADVDRFLSEHGRYDRRRDRVAGEILERVADRIETEVEARFDTVATGIIARLDALEAELAARERPARAVPVNPERRSDATDNEAAESLREEAERARSNATAHMLAALEEIGRAQQLDNRAAQRPQP